jgi:hypothetical protein
MKRFVINSSLSLIFGLGLTLALLWLFDETPPVAHADPGDLFASFCCAWKFIFSSRGSARRSR